jgi:hypothetical protein
MVGMYDVNNHLLRLYQKYWDGLLSTPNRDRLGNPLLIHINDEEKYQNADLKIMFFGQETNTWEGKLGDKSIDELLHTYSEFFGKGKCFRYGGQFWNAVRDYVHSIKQMAPDKNVEFAWNNLIKLGKADSKGRPEADLIEFQRKEFPVIKREIEILKPDLMIFFTGPYYDRYIADEWSDVIFSDIQNWKKRELAAIKHERLPANAFRTYHPNYLYRRGKLYYSDVKETIFSDTVGIF